MVDELDREALQLERESVRLTQDQVIDSDNEVGDDSDNDSEPFCEDHFFIKCFKMVFIISYKISKGFLVAEFTAPIVQIQYDFADHSG